MSLIAPSVPTPVVLNDGNDETETISGLTRGATYDIYVHCYR